MLNDEIESKLDDYVQAYDAIKNRVGIDSVASVILQEIAKDARMAEIRSERRESTEESATEKQLAFLRRLGVSVDRPLSKQEASMLIDEATEQERREPMVTRIHRPIP